VKIYIQLITIIFYFACQNLVFAKDIIKPYFQNVSDGTSDPVGIVMAFVNDNNGLLWIGTQQGLFRYDGYNYKHFTHQPDNANSLPGNNVRSLLLARNGKIWIGTSTAGISIFDPITETFIHLPHNENDNNSLASNHVSKIVETKNGIFFIATLKGVDSYDPQTEKFSHYQKAENSVMRSNTIITLMLDQQENLWIGTNRGVNFLANNSSTVTVLTELIDDSYNYLKQVIHSFIEDKKGNIWIGTASDDVGVIDLKKNTILKINLPHEGTRIIKQFLQVSPEKVWVATNGNGVYQINTDTYKVSAHFESSLAAPGSLSSSRINTMHKTRDGVIWLGHVGAGLEKIIDNNDAFSSFQANVGSDRFLNVLSLLEVNEGEVWLGTNHGVEILDIETGKTTDFSAKNNGNHFPDGGILSIVQQKGFVWIGSKRGLFKTEIGSSEFKKHDVTYKGRSFRYSRVIASTAPYLWLYNFNIIFRLNTNTNEVIRYIPDEAAKSAFSTIKIYNAFEDKHNQLWIASNNGVFLIRPQKNNKVIKVNTIDINNKNLGLRNVLSVMQGIKGDLWLDSEQGLFNSFKINNNTITLTKAPVAFKRKNNQRFSNIQVDSHGRIWSPTAMYDPMTRKTWEFNLSDGIDIGTNWLRSSNKTQKGQLLFGGTKGVVMINPDNFTPWNYIPNVVMTELRLDSLKKTVPSNNKIIIDNDVSNISIDFSSLDYSSPDSLEYKYKLEGYDASFVKTELGTHNATYTNLPPGEYHLWVKATNRIGTWGDKKNLVSFTVLPHFYETWWFKLQILILVLVLIYLLHKARLNKIIIHQQKENDREIAIERAQLMTELVENKNKLLADVSHELRTPLTVLKLQVESLQHNLDDDVGASYQALDEKLSDIGRLISDIYQLAQSDIGALELNLDDLEFPEAVNDWVKEFELLVRSNNLSWQFKNQLPQTVSINADINRIKQVLANLINNSVKYTDKPGKVCLSVYSKDSQLYITIEDSSPSVPANLQSQIFERLYRVEESRSRETGGSGLGLAICKSLIEAHNGIITASTSNQGGLTVTIQIPIN